MKLIFFFFSVKVSGQEGIEDLPLRSRAHCFLTACLCLRLPCLGQYFMDMLNQEFLV